VSHSPFSSSATTLWWTLPILERSSRTWGPAKDIYSEVDLYLRCFPQQHVASVCAASAKQRFCMRGDKSSLLLEKVFLPA